MSSSSPSRAPILAPSRMLFAIGAMLAAFVASGPSASASTHEPTCFGEPATVVLTAESPDYTDTEGVRDVVVDVDGVDNVIDTGKKHDLVCAGDGDDVVALGPAGDRADGGLGNDTLFGGNGNDELIGGPGDDLIVGQIGRDTLHGGDGNDRIFGKRDPDVITGGPGNDYLAGQAGDDEVHGGDGDDRMIGGPDDDTMTGGPGVDRLHGGLGDDDLDGGDGDDVVRGTLGRDTVSGGPGDDRVFGGPNADVVSGGAGDDWIWTGSGDETLGFGNPYRNDVARGGPGNDVIVGGPQRDWLYGGDGDDTIFGKQGDDLIVTGAGADRSHAGRGYDQVWTGATFGHNADVDARIDGGSGYDACEAATDQAHCESFHGNRSPEEWRPLVTEVFTAWGIEQEVDNALAVLACESNGDPFSRNVSSDTRGLFQHRPFAYEPDAPADFFWGARVQRVIDEYPHKAVGFPDTVAEANPFDPVHNANVAALLVFESATYPHWGGPWSDAFAWYPWGHWHCGEITYGLWVAQEGDPSRWLVPNVYD